MEFSGGVESDVGRVAVGGAGPCRGRAPRGVRCPGPPPRRGDARERLGSDGARAHHGVSARGAVTHVSAWDPTVRARITVYPPGAR